MVFRFIDEDGSRLTELADRSGITKQAVGEVVTKLERLGYTRRVVDPADGRAKIMQLTDRGRQAQTAGARILADVEARWAEQYDERRVETLRGVLEDIAASHRGAKPAV